MVRSVMQVRTGQRRPVPHHLDLPGTRRAVSASANYGQFVLPANAKREREALCDPPRKPG